jgi:two-component system, chemotaxis family, CheB/CheR fusion protein
LVPNLQSFPIAGIGASAGGVEALEGFFRGIPPESRHRLRGHHPPEPERESQLPQIIQRYTPSRSMTAADGMEVEPDHVYVLPFDAIQTIKDGCLASEAGSPTSASESPSTCSSARSASDQGELAVSVVLSGGDGDGALGTKAVKERGGLTMAQAPDEHGPGHPEMPKSAIATGYVDFVLPASEMGAKLVQFASGTDPMRWNLILDAADPRPQKPSRTAATEICNIIRHQIGHDFTGYKTKTFFRRVQRRMQVRQARDA